MFQLIRSSFGPFQQLQISHRPSNNHFTIVPEYGASLLNLQLNGRDILDAYTTVDELKQHDWYKSEWLFPFPNRLKNGQYTFEGKSYEFPINNPETGNALHGFSAGKAYEVVRIELQEEEAHMHCRHQYEGQDVVYPFSFQVDIHFSLKSSGHFEVEMQVKNTGDRPLPMGLGWHPYFRLDGEVDSWSLQLPPSQQIAIDEWMIPTGGLLEFDVFEDLTPIGAHVLDSGFLLRDTSSFGQASVTLSDSLGHLMYWQETGPGKFNYLQVFTPPARKSIALEPMTCNIDAFNNGDGLQRLEVGAQMGGRFGCSYQGKAI
ncbi:MAG: hypothetical protein AAFP19_15930 [Bacteroidota bacterium]